MYVISHAFKTGGVPYLVLLYGWVYIKVIVYLGEATRQGDTFILVSQILILKVFDILFYFILFYNLSF